MKLIKLQPFTFICCKNKQTDRRRHGAEQTFTITQEPKQEARQSLVNFCHHLILVCCSSAGPGDPLLRGARVHQDQNHKHVLLTVLCFVFGCLLYISLDLCSCCSDLVSNVLFDFYCLFGFDPPSVKFSFCTWQVSGREK